MYVCVEDITKPDTSPVTGIFFRPQNDQNLTGYIGFIDDSDPRINNFLTSHQQELGE